jgi:hypothetical protein
MPPGRVTQFSDEAGGRRAFLGMRKMKRKKINKIRSQIENRYNLEKKRIFWWF